MKWLKDKYKDRLGEERIIKKFLFFPLTVNNETRWLETVEIDQILICREEFHHESCYAHNVYWWHNMFWADKRYNGEDRYEEQIVQPQRYRMGVDFVHDSEAYIFPEEMLDDFKKLTKYPEEDTKELWDKFRPFNIGLSDIEKYTFTDPELTRKEGK